MKTEQLILKEMRAQSGARDKYELRDSLKTMPVEELEKLLRGDK